ncbi:MAG: Gfo/Idh/MocA family oxidoreductase [Bryobacteraceae bacterium]
MKEPGKLPRRDFLKSATLLAGTPALMAQRSPSDRIGVACIGVGTRGHQLLTDAQPVPNSEIRVICDLYDGNVKRALGLCKNPKVRVVHEWEKAVADPDIDVVLIATPDFWHAPMVIAAAQAKKDIYVEKGWCTNLKEAKAMRQAVRDHKTVMQLGHHYNSLPTFTKAREVFQSGQLGQVPLVRTYIDRTSVHPEWKFYTWYEVWQPPKEAGPSTIDWERFLANAPKKVPFNLERFFTWRCFWDYGTGIAGDLMSHLWDSVNMVMGMGIPESAVTQGGLYFWQDEREVPDQWNVAFDYPKRKQAVTFACTFNSVHVGEMAQYLGRDMTLEVSPKFCRTYGAEWKPDYSDKVGRARKMAEAGGLDSNSTPVQPDYAFKKGDVEVSNHMENFLECVRSRGVPRCGVDRAFEEAVTIVMSVEAFRQERKVKWDAVKEEIV